MNKTEKNSYWLIFSSNQLLLEQQNNDYLIPSFSELPAWLNPLLQTHKLGCFNGSDSYCAELIAPITLPPKYKWLAFKSALELIQPDCFNMAAKAIQILNWGKNHQYCGRCGQATMSNATIFERSCKACKLFFYPRISPSIIVLIKKGRQILMARKANFPAGIFALIAGFVEPGESIEDTLHREVKEEVGITIKNINYFASQSWPFPDSLMFAFIAEYESGEIVVDKVEIESAGWYDFDNLPGMPASRISIARKLIDAFINEQQQLKNSNQTVRT